MKQPNKNCVQCGKAFYTPPCLERIKFCSSKCYHENRKTWKLSDEWKQKISDSVKKNLPSTAWKKGQHFSPETEFKKGERLEENHPRWKGGKTSYRRIAKRNKNWICEQCGKKEKLHVHHINENRNNNNIENLMILCCKCHMILHKGKLPDGV